MKVEKSKRREKSASYYDRIYRKPYDTTRFHEVYNAVMDQVSALDAPECEPKMILECGCGTGALASRFLNAGYCYSGFDFSAEAIRKCPEDVQQSVFEDTVYRESLWKVATYNIVVAVEVLEHIEDLKMLSLIPKGKYIVFSVPNFHSEPHLRIYPDLDSIIHYYADVLHICAARHIQTQVDKHITVCTGVKR